MYLHIHAHMYTCTGADTYIYIYTCCIYIYMHLFIIYVCTCMIMFFYVLSHAFMFTCVYVLTYVFVRLYNTPHLIRLVHSKLALTPKLTFPNGDAPKPSYCPPLEGAYVCVYMSMPMHPYMCRWLYMCM